VAPLAEEEHARTLRLPCRLLYALELPCRDRGWRQAPAGAPSGRGRACWRSRLHATTSLRWVQVHRPPSTSRQLASTMGAASRLNRLLFYESASLCLVGFDTGHLLGAPRLPMTLHVPMKLEGPWKQGKMLCSSGVGETVRRTFHAVSDLCAMHCHKRRPCECYALPQAPLLHLRSAES